MKRNVHLGRLKANYLFPEINERKKRFLEKHPQTSLISLGIGDTTQPIKPGVVGALKEAAINLGTSQGYTGYSPESGMRQLREQIAMNVYSGSVHADEVFISDGAKCDIGRLQVLFGHEISIAVQDPAYPVYVDGSLMQGVQHIAYMPCMPENQFFLDSRACLKQI